MKNVWQWILSTLIILTLISCGNSTDDGKIDTEPTTQGTVYDDLIVGLNYQTKDYSSKTNNDGKFNYKSGEVKFYIGSLYIGKIPKLTKDKKVFLSDILNLKRGDYRTKELVKLATLLQSLDTTPINDETIVLDENNIKELFTSNQTLENLDLNKLNLTLPKTKEVKQRVRDTLVQQNITPIDNINPTAKAGNNQTKEEGQSITLDGSSSTDSDGTITKYEWLENNQLLSTKKSFTKNDFSVGTHTITLKVTDDEEATHSDSIVITITAKEITPTPTNKLPVANAGDDQTAQEGQSVTLDASSSTDSDGTIVAYEWSENNQILSTQKSFTKSDFSVGVHTITLTVTDNKEAAATHEVKVVISKKPPTNKPPVANAGDDINKKQNEVVTLDGSSSTDEDISSLKYEWFENGTTLSTQKAFTKSNFTVGVHTITLKVTDNKGATASDTVKVTITDITPPTATITPANMATDVSLVSNITITFSEKVKGIDDKNITLSKAGSTIPLAYTLTNDNNTTLTLNPTASFDNGTSYTITIEKVEDNAGNTINPTTSTFTTLYGKYLKTGQTTSYQAKDDGDYKKGVDRSYTRKELNATAGIVTDNVTRLTWQDDNESGTTQRTWNDAQTYCDTLTLGGFEDWRLPNTNELETIVDYGRARNNPTGSLGAINPIFKYVGQAGYSIYWSSTTHLSYSTSAWNVNFNYGNDNWNNKSNTNYVRCVREFDS